MKNQEKTKKGYQQQDGGNQDTDGFIHRNSVEVTGEVSNGDDTNNLALIVNNGRFTAQGDAQAATANCCGALSVKHFSVIVANQLFSYSVGINRMKQMDAFFISDNNKTGVAMRGYFFA
ncbi:Uncharacterised protein [Citrobacter koseri]|uniref:Uncharacterized protein n=1 Tax=Citrobacter koseri TaxID=545 RepID=A0A2X2XI93_CITKO|nr:Uncharacterised protein [Citrobacter koseri]